MFPTINGDFSGIQILMILGVALLIAGVRPDLGVLMVFLGIGGWLIYNLLSLGRQF